MNMYLFMPKTICVYILVYSGMCAGEIGMCLKVHIWFTFTLFLPNSMVIFK